MPMPKKTREEKLETKRQYRRKWMAANREKHLKSLREYRARVKARGGANTSHSGIMPGCIITGTTRGAIRKNLYGLTLAAFNSMAIAQDKKCAICPTPLGPKNKTQVDHDHATGNVRALLCPRCNMVLGLVGDSSEWLERFILYLRRHRNQKLT